MVDYNKYSKKRVKERKQKKEMNRVITNFLKELKLNDNWLRR